MTLTYELALLFILGTPALVPIGAGAWAYFVGSSKNCVRLAVCAGAAALVSAATLGWCMKTLHDDVLRFKAIVGAFGVAAIATSLLLGMAAGFFWKRGPWLTRAILLATLAAFTCAVGFFNGVILVWGSEL